LAQKLQKTKTESSKKPKITKPTSDSDDDDVPLAAKFKPKNSPQTKKSSSPIAAKKQAATKYESDDDDDIPLAQTKSKPKPKSNSTKRPKPKSDSDDDVPLAAKSKKPKVEKKSQTANGTKKSPAAKKPSVKEEDDPDVKPEGEDEEYRWWEENQNDGSVKWTTLEHNGVLFPPPYEPLPKHVKMKYDGKEVTLPPEAEEVAGFFAALIEADHGNNPIFQKNFFNDWLDVLKKNNAVSTLFDWQK
jgi:DNA topoisomerase I